MKRGIIYTLNLLYVIIVLTIRNHIHKSMYELFDN